MAGYLLDTNVVSELRKGYRADRGVIDWFNNHADDSLWLSVLVVGELRRGAELLKRRDTVRGAQLEEWLDKLVDQFADRVLPVGVEHAEQWARLNVPDPVPIIDGLLAATAIVNGLILVTRNTADVERTGVQFENPFQSG